MNVEPSIPPHSRHPRRRVILLSVLGVGMLGVATWGVLSWLDSGETAGPKVCQRQVIVSVPNDEAMGVAVDALITLPGVVAINPQDSQEVWEWYQTWPADPDRKELAQLIKVEQMKPETTSAMVWLAVRQDSELETLAAAARTRLTGDGTLVEIGQPCQAPRE